MPLFPLLLPFNAGLGLRDWKLGRVRAPFANHPSNYRRVSRYTASEYINVKGAMWSQKQFSVM